MTTKWGTLLRVLGLDKPERIEGGWIDHGTIDEFANTKPGTFDAHLRPMLLETNGSMDFIGVPDMDGPNQAEYEKMVDRSNSGDPDWQLFHWSTAEVQAREMVEADRATMDPLIYRQEYGGEFVTSSGKFAPDYDRAIHVKECNFDHNRQICWTSDFNVGRMCSIIIQDTEFGTEILDELVVPTNKTEVATNAFLDRLQERGWMATAQKLGIGIYGDASGHAHDSTSGITDWYIIRNMLKNLPTKFNVLTSNYPGSIADSRNAVNARIRTADGRPHLKINPRCKQLIDDLRSATWPSDLENQHCLAALRYYCLSRHPVVPDRGRSSGDVGFAG